MRTMWKKRVGGEVFLIALSAALSTVCAAPCAAAAEPSYYVRKDTWQETIRASCDGLAEFNKRHAAWQAEKLKALAGRVKGQARRADAIVKNMNAFSHTVDYPFRSVDLGEMVGLTVALAARMTSMRGGKVEFEPPGEAVSVATSPFHLHMQLWGCIDSALSHLDENCSLRVQCRKRDQGAAVLFTGLKGTDCGELGVPPPRHQPELLRLLGARVFPSEDGRGFCLDLPGEAPGYRP